MTTPDQFPAAPVHNHADLDLPLNDKSDVFHAALIQQVERYCSRFPQEQESLAPLKSQLAMASDPLNRTSMPGHITASGIVLCERKMLMIFHPFLKKWLQPGGHVESGEVPVQAAQRELLEETGVRGTLHAWHQQHGIPLDISIHAIPANPKKQEPEHWHYDFRYLFISDGSICAESESDHVVAWKNREDIDEVNLLVLIRKLESEHILRNDL